MVTDPFERRYRRVPQRPPLRFAPDAARGGAKAHHSAPIRLLAAAVGNHAVLRQLQEGVVPGLLLRYGRALGNHAVRRLLARCRQP
jgi:hypothetical protein